MRQLCSLWVQQLFYQSNLTVLINHWFRVLSQQQTRTLKCGHMSQSTKNLTTEQWKKRWRRMRQQHQWQLLREQKLWGAATSGDLTIHSFSHSAAKLHSGEIHSWIKGSRASGGLATERASRCAQKKKHCWEGNNHHFFLCMVLRNSAILQQPSFMPTGALVKLFKTCVYCLLQLKEWTTKKHSLQD